MKNLFGRSWLIAVFIFLYIPIVTLVVYSFNDSRLSTVWTGFTFKWYVDAAHDRELIDGLIISLKLAFMSGILSVIFGTFTAFVLVRYGRFKGRTLLSSMANAPLVMPDVIVGISLLLMLVALQKWLGFPERGIPTILLGHALIGTSFATVVIISRLREIDRRLEEAAMDLGCKPFQVFMLVTLPLIASALVSAFLLTFTLSFDDVVVAAFLSGPGSTTLPLVIFSRARLGLDPSINAVATIIIVVVSIGVIASSLYQLRSQKRRQREISEAYGQSSRS
ncbi:putrescine ABC transporter permease PotI [Halothiobacillus diazotrophicus]|uniref:Putrescine ABC transporter permease PotI n=1 Tax=Halothiobacillus diazotrophicus TaxID=1860122 RepID=A0A191ZHZ6_9GAMM|nr:ABC transporter permease subunit [Halothiobacillus diazotrophicus]ANJ67490.1 putrescine ABC transporter permease PotI [Halothiobacillus diazotrophicus]